MGFWAALAVALVMQVISYVLMPKPKTSSGDRQSQNLKTPTAEAGKPVPVIFGEGRIMSPNILFYGDVSKRQYGVDA